MSFCYWISQTLLTVSLKCCTRLLDVSKSNLGLLTCRFVHLLKMVAICMSFWNKFIEVVYILKTYIYYSEIYISDWVWAFIVIKSLRFQIIFHTQMVGWACVHKGLVALVYTEGLGGMCYTLGYNRGHLRSKIICYQSFFWNFCCLSCVFLYFEKTCFYSVPTNCRTLKLHTHIF